MNDNQIPANVSFRDISMRIAGYRFFISSQAQTKMRDRLRFREVSSSLGKALGQHP
jgi:hypothetical protein